MPGLEGTIFGCVGLAQASVRCADEAGVGREHLYTRTLGAFDRSTFSIREFGHN